MTSTNPDQTPALTAPNVQLDEGMKSVKALGTLTERITPWLFEVGSWIFGSLIALNLLIMASLITVGAVDRAIIVSSVALAIALPLNVTGLFLLRLVQDLQKVGFEHELAQAFQEAGLTLGKQEIPSLEALEMIEKKRPAVALIYSFTILQLSLLLTLTGLIAALWHIAWWIGVVFFAMALICLCIIFIALATLQPPTSAAAKEQKRRQRAEIIRQAKEQRQRNNQRA